MLFFSGPDATTLPQERAGDHLAQCQVFEMCGALSGALQKNATLSSPIGAQTITAPLNFKCRTIYRFTSGTANN
jgi:hypothetical protein